MPSPLVTSKPSPTRQRTGRLSTTQSTSQTRQQPVGSSTLQPAAARSSPGLPHYRHWDDSSWVEVSSRPSSSSLSSVGDEIITTGLCVGGFPGRRRRLQTVASRLAGQNTTARTTATTFPGSQDEYDESEGDEDGPLASSAESVSPQDEVAALQDLSADSDMGSDDADNLTALGRESVQPVFRPRPNAFSHPPHNVTRRHCSGLPTGTTSAYRYGGISDPVSCSRPRSHRGGPSFMMSSYSREEDDVALRTSLTTLLSCAAAARRLPKSREDADARSTGGNGVGTSNQPVGLHLVAESELEKEGASPPPRAVHNSPRVPRSPTRGAAALWGKTRRSSLLERNPCTTRRKKGAAMGADDCLISPTLLTWVVSAGVIVLVSIVGFGAGYVLGREVGRREVLSSTMGCANETAQYGREVMHPTGGSLRRLRWGAVGKSIVANA